MGIDNMQQSLSRYYRSLRAPYVVDERRDFVSDIAKLCNVSRAVVAYWIAGSEEVPEQHREIINKYLQANA